MLFGASDAAREAVRKAELKQARRQGAEKFRERAVNILTRNAACVDRMVDELNSGSIGASRLDARATAFRDAAHNIASLPALEESE